MIMKYKNYVAHIAYHEDGDYFHGEVIGLSGGISFEGASVKELKQAFKDSVDFYLDLCKERGVKPEKAYSGNIRLLMISSLHRALALQAAQEEISLNSLINRVLTSHVTNHEQSEEKSDLAQEESLVLLPST